MKLTIITILAEAISYFIVIEINKLPPKIVLLELFEEYVGSFYWTELLHR